MSGGQASTRSARTLTQVPRSKDESKETALLTSERVLVVLAFAFLLFMMVFHLTYSPLWGDEWVELHYSQLPIMTGELYEAIISTFQPPLYNFLLHFWLMLSTSHFWFRFFNVCVGLAAGIFLYLTIKKVATVKLAALSVVILAACYEWIFCVQEASEYALMLGNLFAALYFYVSSLKRYSKAGICWFVFFCAAAMYSQYGAFFVVGPLLISFLIQVFVKGKRRHRIFVTAVYLVAFVALAVPLVLVFFLNQTENFGGGSDIPLAVSTFITYPTTFGELVAYFFHLDGIPGAGMLSGLFFAVCFIGCVHAWYKGAFSGIVKSLIVCVFVAYTLHYLLVTLHIYAMVHEGESYGFFCRYSYFYIPLLFVAFPTIIHGAGVAYKRGQIVIPRIIAPEGWRAIKWVLCIIGAVAVGISLVFTLLNWHKSFGDEYADIWIEHSGWQTTTYTYGVYSDEELEYYVSRSEGFKPEYLDNVVTEGAPSELPDSFWIWRCNWSGGGADNVIAQAKDENYSVTCYHEHINSLDSRNVYQLFYCTK